ncbi:MAG: phytoene desaturase family protein [Novosphingobium sp.]|nr:phytoene desaturase family protein [Novosphingobium sp.]
MKRACVIGAGFGGLALAIRLQSSGVETVVVEAREAAGGQAHARTRDGFTFDAGPAAVTDPASLRELWQLSGHDMADDIALLPVSPIYRLNWPDGVNFDYSGDDAALRGEIARFSPTDLEGYDDFTRYAAAVHAEVHVRLGHMPFLDFAGMARAVPALVRHQAWRSLHSMVSGFMKNERLREAFSFRTLLVGGNPMTTSAIHALAHKLERDGGVWWPKGGMHRLAGAMARHFERLGGTMRAGDPAVRVHTIGDRASEVETARGWRERFDAVASNADVMHTYRDLLSGAARGGQMAGKLARKRFSPGLFAVHFAVEGTWPGIPHTMILFGPRYAGLLKDIHDHGVLPADSLICLSHPSVTDPSLAPPGKSVFRALVPVANMGKLPIDWAETGPLLERRVLDEVGLRLIPDIHDRIVTSFHTTPADAARDLNAFQGSAFGLEPLLRQSAWLRPHNRDGRIGNFYLVGAGTHPGAGLPGVVAGAKVTAKLMLDDLA